MEEGDPAGLRRPKYGIYPLPTKEANAGAWDHFIEIQVDAGMVRKVAAFEPLLTVKA